jgi:hypothetical protein
MLYFAYGSNLSIRAMRRRCPRAVPLGKFALGNSKLVFRGVADCPFEQGSKCWGGVWRITDRCEAALDRYEGWHPDQLGSYRKEFVPLRFADGREDTLMFYQMNSDGIFPPSEYYLDTLRDGYRDFKLPMSHLRAALKDAWENKNPSHLERKRYRRDGRPRLAELPPPKKAVKTGLPTTGNLFGLTEENA